MYIWFTNIHLLSVVILLCRALFFDTILQLTNVHINLMCFRTSDLFKILMDHSK